MNYRKKPVVIEAFQMTEARRADNSEWPNWLNQAWQMKPEENGSVSCVDYPNSDGTDKLQIRTLEGMMLVGWDDFIIKGVKGELYPCKPNIFEATYSAEASAPTEPTVILINRALSYGSVGSLTGMTGFKYGDSFFEEAYGAHVCRMPLSEWRKCKQDVTNAAHSRYRQWEVDIELPDSPVSSEDVIGRIRNATPDELDAIASSMPPIVLAIHERHKALRVGGAISPALTGEGEAPVMATGIADGSPTATSGDSGHTLASLSLVTNFRLMLKIAKEAGVENADNINSVAELRRAILEKQGQGVVIASAQGEDSRTQPAAGPVPEYYDVKPPVEEKKHFAGGCAK